MIVRSNYPDLIVRGSETEVSARTDVLGTETPLPEVHHCEKTLLLLPLPKAALLIFIEN